MSNHIPEHELESTPQDLGAEARRWVRRKRILYSILGIYAALSLMWFAIDMADGTESLWFYWPMLGVGIAVAITSVVLLGMGGLFGVSWEQRQIDRYLKQRGRADKNS
jgi:2TM domain